MQDCQVAEEEAPVDPQPPSNSVLARKRPRAKRGKYISKACTECKRRKSKCNGQHPCGHCVYHSLHCHYPPSPARPTPGASTDSAGLAQVVESLKKEVASLQGNLEYLRHQQQNPASVPATSPEDTIQVQAQPQLPANEHVVAHPETQDAAGSLNNPVGPYAGPATSLSFGSSAGEETRQPSVKYTFNLSLARKHLQEQSAEIEVIDAPDVSRPGSPPSNLPESSSTVDPLWHIDKREALRLAYVYEEEIGISYPFLIIEDVIHKTNLLYDAMEVGLSSGFPVSCVPGPTVIDADDLTILRLVFATASTIETSGVSELGKALFLKARDAATRKLWEPPTVKSILHFTLLAIHEFLVGDDLTAWRIIGIPARWALELGLHQSATFKGMEEGSVEQRMLVRAFWSVHTLDRRWAFGVGLPFVFQSSDIDANTPMPDDDVPYLQNMVWLAKISARIWSALSNSTGGTEPPREEVEFLHYRIDRWLDELPESLKLNGDGTPVLPQTSRGVRRLQLILYLRARQMKIFLYQRALHAPSPANSYQVKMVVETAKDMVQKLDHLNRTTDIYQTQQQAFHHFLLSALGVIFLAVAREPAVYRSVVRDEFNMALALVSGFRETSYVSKRLWKMIRGLRQAALKLGINGNQPGEMDTSRGANNAPPMSLMSPPNSTSHAFADENPPGTGAGNAPDDVPMFPLNGSQMTLELSNIFTAMDNEHGFPMPGFASGAESIFEGGNQEGDFMSWFSF